MGWLSALGESWGQSNDRWAQQRELERKWQMQQAEEARAQADHVQRQRVNQLAILKDEAALARLPKDYEQQDTLFGLDKQNKEQGLKNAGQAYDQNVYTFGRDKAAGGREDQWYEFLRQNPDLAPEKALMAAARFGVDPTKTAGFSAKLNTDLQREQMRSNAIIAAAQARGPYGRGGYGYTQPSDYTESIPEKFRRETATQDLKRMPTSLSELMQARTLEAQKGLEEGQALSPEQIQKLRTGVADEWTNTVDPKLQQALADAMPDTIQGEGFRGAQGIAEGFDAMSRDVTRQVATYGPEKAINDIADSPELNEDEKEMLRQQVLQVAGILGQNIDPNYRPKVYREPYGYQPPRPVFGIGNKYGSR